jgi:cytochrome c oxidase subunit 4
MSTTHTTAHAHVLPRSTYYAVYAALLVLLLATVGAAYLNLGAFNFLVSMVIAVIKGILIMLIFMHVRYSERLVWIFATAAFLWLAVLIGMSLNDYLTRGWLNIPGK